MKGKFIDHLEEMRKYITNIEVPDEDEDESSRIIEWALHDIDFLQRFFESSISD